MKTVKQNKTLKNCCVHTSGVTCCLVAGAPKMGFPFHSWRVEGWCEPSAFDNPKPDSRTHPPPPRPAEEIKSH
jgi:hypothetical protein